MEKVVEKQFQISSGLKAKLDEILAKYETKRAALLPVLNLFQTQYGHVSTSMTEAVAEYLGLPVMKVEEVVSFYTLYLKKPAGKYRFQVCRTLSCCLSGAEKIKDHLRNRLGIKEGETSADGLYSLEEVECLGACETAPVIRLNDQYIGSLTPEKVDKVLKELK